MLYMGEALIGKLTDNLYIIREGRNSLETKDYIVYITSLDNSKPIKVLSIRELKTNIKRGLDKILEPFLEELKKEDLYSNFNTLIAFIFLLKVKLYVDYILKKSLENLPLMEAISIRDKVISLAYQIALYLKDNESDLVIPEAYQKVLFDQELFEKFFKIMEDVTFRSNQYVVKRAFVNFSTEINKFFQN